LIAVPVKCILDSSEHVRLEASDQELRERPKVMRAINEHPSDIEEQPRAKTMNR
jgi:hypothetical protein